MSTPTIIYQDSDLLVIDKPAGLTVNTSDTTIHEQTVQDWVEKQYDIQSQPNKDVSESDFYKRGGIVHRIDKETSGILLIAKNEDSFLNLQSQFKLRTVHKTYHTLVHGIVKPSEGEVTVPIGRLPWNRRLFGVVAGGREAYTSYKVLKHVQDSEGLQTYSYLEVSPKTGRTHQIRVHMKYLQHPIVADALYSGRKTSRNSREQLSRLFLHAHSISFLHPHSQKELTFISELPQELNDFMKSLKEVPNS